MGANSSVPAKYDAPAYVILSLELGLTTAAVLGRIASRRVMRAPLAADDYMAYLAYLTNLGLLICALLLTSSGTLDLDAEPHQSNKPIPLIRSSWDGFATLYVFDMTLIKCSILFMYRRTFTMITTWFRNTWWAVLTLTLLWTTACVILLALQATGTLPKHGFSRLGISITGLVNAITDWLILALPLYMVAQMKLQRKQKLALVSIFMVGSIASLVSIVRAAIFFINRDHHLNEAYSDYLDIVLTATEASAGMMCACLPLMKPLLVRATRWVQRLRGQDTAHQGWTSVDASNASNMPCQEKRGDSVTTLTRGFGEVDTVQLLRSSTSGDRFGGGMQSEKARSHWERRRKSAVEAEAWEVQRTWGSP